MNKSFNRAAFWLSLALPINALAQTNSVSSVETDDDNSAIILPEIALIGSEEAVATLPASGAFIGRETISRYGTADIARIVQGVPGVYSRGEDGYGLFPNISLRGVSTERMKSVTMMEDGILTAPAPYSAPSAYYSPNAARMEGVEILKGSSQIKYGPHITGGAINYLSTSIPTERQTYLKLQYGSNHELLAHAWHGATEELEKFGTVGYLVEGFFHRTDGFKTIDGAPGIADRDDTGFTRFEPMVKMFWELPFDKYHRIEARYSYSELDADETYLGLTDADFRADPNRRYSATRFDNIATEIHRASLRHIMELTPKLRVSTTGYLQYFQRNWEKLDRVDGVSLAQAMLDTAPGGSLAVIRGGAAGTLSVRNNAREYAIYGIQNVISTDFDLGPTEHDLEFGVRYHYDDIDRFQWDVNHTQNAAGAITASPSDPLGEAGDRIQESRALALHIQDEVKWDRFTVTPGVRVENIAQFYNQNTRRTDVGAPAPASGNNHITALSGGGSIAYAITPQWNTFFGVHRGFTVPGPRAANRQDLNEETSLSFELGTRYTNEEKALRAELVLFRTDFNDLIVGGNLAAGGITENVGNIDSMGVEMLVAYDHGRANDWAIHTPTRLSVTLTDASLDGNATNLDPDSLFQGGVDGNRVPYIPEYMINGEIGIEYKKAGAYVNMTYVPQTYTSASNSRAPIRNDGVPDARIGKTDNYFVTDFNLRYGFREGMTFFGGVKNLFNRRYIASRHPYAARPGLPRFFNVGVEMLF